ncbi:hypothetical protein QYF36_017629 [Acer negundo]|nr:hypothetical protein QYF36_017629 [Acer negundo]
MFGDRPCPRSVKVFERSWSFHVSIKKDVLAIMRACELCVSKPELAGRNIVIANDSKVLKALLPWLVDVAVFPLFAAIPCFCASLVSYGWWIVEGAGVVLLTRQRE